MKMSNKAYDILKFIAQIVLPALATFWVTLSSIWGLPFGDEISRTIMAIDTLLGAILMISNANYRSKIKDKELEEQIGSNGLPKTVSILLTDFILVFLASLILPFEIRDQICYLSAFTMYSIEVT